ncbi:MAG: hypothetical protein COV45_04245 [Deltaproteobacteria bacterium CG11_big_fil_rev_8_21_14_0_20_47_16]|nr:MAG: hypothetical protein COV45_04245 [Deltaproteobacteria bacterium CG11_big_fil_rev_8_21_14_0_20_47_16]
MKKLWIICVALILPAIAISYELRQVDVIYGVEAQLLGTHYSSMSWLGSGPMRYQWGDGAGELINSDIPAMRQLLPLTVPGYQPVVLELHGKSDSRAKVQFERSDVVVTGLGFEVQAVELVSALNPATAVRKSGRPMISIPFDNLRLTTGEITIDGKKMHGKLDPETMSAELVFLTFVPKTGNPDLDDAIAGKSVAGRVRISLKNPYTSR